jgi:hypothetical protein
MLDTSQVIPCLELGLVSSRGPTVYVNSHANHRRSTSNTSNIFKCPKSSILVENRIGGGCQGCPHISSRNCAVTSRCFRVDVVPLPHSKFPIFLCESWLTLREQMGYLHLMLNPNPWLDFTSLQVHTGSW